MCCGLAQVEPRLVALPGRTVDWDLVMRPQRRYAFPGPAIAMTRGQLVSIENAGDQFIVGDKNKLPDCCDDVL
jgi:hypothetical protein